MSTGRTATDPRRRLSRLPVALLALGVFLLIALLVDRIFFESSTSPEGAGSGVAATQSRSLPPFTGVELTGDNNVIVAVGAKQAVTVHADSNLLGRVTTRVRSGRLVIGTTPGNLSAKTPMFVAVSLPTLDGLSLQGDGNISATGIESRKLTVALPGTGNVEATGTTTTLDVTVGGEGTALLRGLIARNAKAVLSGDGTIMVTATDSLSARLSGTGAVLYGGNPSRVTQSVTGSGTISPG